MDIATEQTGAPTAAELAIAFGGAAPASPPPPADPPKPAAVRWLTDKPRTSSYDLVFPFELDGVEYRLITLRRLTAGEVEAFLEKMRSVAAASRRFPMYFAGDEALSDAAWNAMDDDDRAALEEAGADFLPARFRQRTASEAS